MPTINEVLERVNRARPDAIDDETKAAWLLELEGKLWREVYLRHKGMPGRMHAGPVRVCPECEETDGVVYDMAHDWSRCTACGWTDAPDYPKKFPEDGDMALLVGAPYDRLYDLYVFAQADALNRETDNYNNSVTAFNAALDDFKKDYHREHPPLGAGYWKKLF